MSKVQEAGLLEALGEAEGLARVLRGMSDGRLDLQPVVRGEGLGTVQPLSFEAAKTEARSIAGTLPSSAARQAGRMTTDVLLRDDGTEVVKTHQAAETFCSNCGCLDEPGVHSQPDCPRYEPDEIQPLHQWRAATRRPEGS